MRGGVPVGPWPSCAVGVISADGWAACGTRGIVGTESATAGLWEAPAGEASLEASVSSSTKFGGVESGKTGRGGRMGGKFVVFTVVSRGAWEDVWRSS